METAKVDVRKLQMLNDRINQTIDALNQVRLSVHGMSTGGIPGGLPGGIPNGILGGTQGGVQGGIPFGGGFPYGQGVGPQGFGGQSMGHTGNPFGQSMNPYFQTPFGHTSNGFGQNGFPGVNPLLAQLWGASPWGQQGGFGHSSPDPRGIGTDPFTQSRIAQTFPFVQWGYSPFASGYTPFASAMY
ncbi:MAG: hypothetical protein ABIP39_07810 [Polyangiaceae bacterium]